MRRRSAAALSVVIGVAAVSVVGVVLLGGDNGDTAGKPSNGGQSEAPSTSVKATDEEPFADEIAAALEVALPADPDILDRYLATPDGAALHDAMAGLAKVDETDLRACKSLPAPVAQVRSDTFLATAAGLPEPVLNEAALTASQAAGGLAIGCSQASGNPAGPDPNRTLRLAAAVFMARLEQVGIEP